MSYAQFISELDDDVIFALYRANDVTRSKFYKSIVTVDPSKIKKFNTFFKNIKNADDQKMFLNTLDEMGYKYIFKMDLTNNKQIKLTKSLDEAKTKIYNSYDEIEVTEFIGDRYLQEALFEHAKKWRQEQDDFMKMLLNQNNINAEYKAIMKRNDFDDFTNGLIEKFGRKEYININEMDDMARGRVNTKSWEDVEYLIKNVKDNQKYEIKKIPPKREADDGTFGYPRYHIIIENPKSGITFEWQIGTKALTDVYELEGIKIPKGLKLKRGMKPNLHDIEYDIFQYLDRKDSDFAKELGIPIFCDKVDNLARKTGKYGYSKGTKEILNELDKLHKEASEILQKLYDIKGSEYIESFYH